MRLPCSVGFRGILRCRRYSPRERYPWRTSNPCTRCKGPTSYSTPCERRGTRSNQTNRAPQGATSWPSRSKWTKNNAKPLTQGMGPIRWRQAGMAIASASSRLRSTHGPTLWKGFLGNAISPSVASTSPPETLPLYTLTLRELHKGLVLSHRRQIRIGQPVSQSLFNCGSVLGRIRLHQLSPGTRSPRASHLRAWTRKRVGQPLKGDNNQLVARRSRRRRPDRASSSTRGPTSSSDIRLSPRGPLRMDMASILAGFH